MARYSSQRGATTFEDYGLITATAYIFGDSSAFRSATNRLITHVREPYSGMRNLPQMGDVFSPQLLLALTELREAVRGKITKELPQIGMPECDVKFCNNHDEAYYSWLIDEFEVKYWPPNLWDDFSIASVVRILRQPDTIQRDSPSCVHTSAISGVSPADFQHLATDIVEASRGLCLRCVKEDRADHAQSCILPEHSERY
ncbi:hypothetical protein LTR37_010635 [Vermiconidia calcicola]|uniref:Uncharacterized protein n=1 Tax=Vermiconidia calcicola TaxID=1690605 RepID=A0ACC3N5X8_9PEZI|nr:hypothetical protein LTR37_010635 [Vermiconidia calcicola]